jgi:hypothetical protein
MNFESCEKVTEETRESDPTSVEMQVPDTTSQILIVLSADAVTSNFESCEKATERTKEVCPSSVCRHASHLEAIGGDTVNQTGNSDRNLVLTMLSSGANRMTE